MCPVPLKVNLQTTNNNATIGSKTNNASPDGSLTKHKRKAPPPPNPFGSDCDYLKVNNHALTDIYEKVRVAVCLNNNLYL